MVDYEQPKKGYMHYACGQCDFCGKFYIKRSLLPIALTWESCACGYGNIAFITADWNTYCNYMEDGAVLVSQI